MTYPNDPYGQQPGYGGPQYPGFGGQYAPPEPDNNLVWAILSTVFCCLPLGIVAIVKSTSVSKLWAQGDFVGAQRAADEAKKWAMWGAIVGVLVVVLSVIVYLVLLFLILGVAANVDHTYTPSYTYSSTF